MGRRIFGCAFFTWKEGNSMNGQDMQMGELLENEAVRQFLQLLTENRPDQGQEIGRAHV